jgi:sugar lactone lactonase YvrE
MTREVTAELAFDCRCTTGEGPLWDHRRGALLWVDIPAGEIHSLAPGSGAHRAFGVGQPVGAVALRADGGLVAAVRDGFAILPAEGGGISELIGVEADRPDNRMNDGRCDSRGRFWAGTMAARTPHAGSLYRLERARDGYRVETMLRGLTIANGLDWTPDDRRMYYIDTPTQRIDLFDFDPERGEIRDRRPFVAIADADGQPDGMVVDADGFVWVALIRRGRVRRYSPHGDVDMEVRVPVSLVTSCTFGGADLDELYITTARHLLTPAEAAAQPTAGGVYVCRPGPVGRRAHLFG